MSSFTGKKVKDTYIDLLQLGNGNDGVTGTVNYIKDGGGTPTPLGLSTSTISISGNVGIGTTNPEQKLHIEDGFLQLSRTTQTNNFIRFQETGDTSFNVGTDVREEAFYITGQSFSNDKLVTVKSAGNVGINNTSPAYKLDIAAPGADAKGIRIHTNNATADSLMLIGGGGTTDVKFKVDGLGNTTIGSTLAINSGSNPANYPYMQFENINETSADGTNLGAIFFKGQQPDGSIETGASVRARGAGDAADTNNNLPAELVFQTNPGGTGGLVERMTITTDGNVGIGTTNPGTKLEVKDSSQGIALFKSDSSAVDAVSFIAIESPSATSNGRTRIGADGDDLFFNTSDGVTSPNTSVERMRIDTSGNVGIGTTNPSAALHVEGDGEFKLRDTSTYSTSAGPVIYFQGNNSSNSIKNFATINAYSSGLDTGDLTFNVRKSNAFPDEEVMRLTSSGNVGIGTTDPTHGLLEVKTSGGDYAFSVVDDTDKHLGGLYAYNHGATTEGLDLYLKQPGGNTKVAIKSLGDSYFTGGNIGIGTKIPGYNLHIAGGTPSLALSGTQPRIWLYETDQTDLNTLIRNNNSIFQIDTVSDNGSATANRLSINNTSGNVGIGIENSPTKLHVIGDISCTGTVSGAGGVVGAGGGGGGGTSNWSFNNGNLYPSVTNYKVGIGTSTPGSVLEISDNSDHLNLKVKNNISQSVIKFSDPDGLAGSINYDHNEDKLHFITDGTAVPANGALNITSDGNVGIGTTSPDNKLTIALSADKNIAFKGDMGEIGSVAGIVAYNDSGQANPVGIRGEDIRFATTNSEVMRINSDGNVGIGTDNPLEALHIKGDGVRMFISSDDRNLLSLGRRADTEPDAGLLAMYKDGNRMISIDTGGPTFFNGDNVGIGTETPTRQLEIFGDTSTWDLLNLTNGNTSGVGLTLSSNSRWSMLSTSDTAGVGKNNIAFHLTQAEAGSGATSGYKMVLTDQGKLGVGPFDGNTLTSPDAELTVAGTGTATNAEDHVAGSTIQILNTTDDVSGAFTALNFQTGDRITASVRSQVVDHNTNNGNLLFYTNEGTEHVQAGKFNSNGLFQVTGYKDKLVYNGETPNWLDCAATLGSYPPNATAGRHTTLQFNNKPAGTTYNSVATISLVCPNTDNNEGYLAFCTDPGTISTERVERMRLTKDGMDVTGDITATGIISAGTITTQNQTTQTIEDKNVTLGAVAGGSHTDATANGGGVILKGDTDKSLTWNNSNDHWELVGGTRLATQGGLWLKDDGDVGTLEIVPPTNYQTGNNMINYFNTTDLVFKGNNTERIRFTNDGKVGIGSNSPTEKLEVAGDIKVDTNGSNDGGVIHFGLTSDKTKIIGRGPTHSNAPNSINFAIDNTVPLYVTKDGLHVTGDITYTGTLSGPGGAVAGGGGATLWELNGSDATYTDGNVGIGTTSPTAKLEINSGTNDANLKLVSTDPFVDIKMSDNTTTDDGVRISNKGDDLLLQRTGGNVGIGTTSPDQKLEIFNGTLKFGTSTAGKNEFEIFPTDEGSKGLGFYDRTNTAYRMIISNTGNVGIGTTTPNAALEINDNGSSLRLYEHNGDASIWFDSSNGDFAGGDYWGLKAVGTSRFQYSFGSDTLFSMTSGGNLGIGTTDPTAPLTIKEANNQAIKMLKSTGQTLFTIGEDGGGNTVLDTTHHDLNGSTSSNDLIITGGNTIATGGNVGIGTMSPQRKLHIQTDPVIVLTDDTGSEDSVQDDGMNHRAIINNLEFLNIGKYNTDFTAYTAQFVIDIDGNVGVGNYSGAADDRPQSLLEVKGDIPKLDLVRAGTAGGGVNGIEFKSLGNGTTVNDRSGLIDLSTPADGTAGAKLNFSTKNGTTNYDTMTLTDGKVGIGTADPSYGLHTLETEVDRTGVAFANTSIRPYGVSCLHTNAQGTAGSPSSGYFYSGAAKDGTGSQATMFQILNNGNMVNQHNVYSSISDEKIKENVVDATPKTEDLKQVRVVNYNLKSDPETKQIGVVAQELEEVFPGMVFETEDVDDNNQPTGESTKNVKYSVFVPMLVKAFQEQQAVIETMQQEIETLKNS